MPHAANFPPMVLSERVHTFGQFLLRRYGERLHKIALDVGCWRALKFDHPCSFKIDQVEMPIPVGIGCG